MEVVDHLQPKVHVLAEMIHRRGEGSARMAVVGCLSSLLWCCSSLEGHQGWYAAGRHCNMGRLLEDKMAR